MFINSSCHTRLRVVGFTIKVNQQGLLLPLSLLVVVVGCQALDGVHPDGDLPVNLGLLLLLVSDGVRKDVVRVFLHPQVSPDAKTNNDQGIPTTDFHSPVGASTSARVWQKLALYRTFFSSLVSFFQSPFSISLRPAISPNIFLKPKNKKTLKLEN